MAKRKFSFIASLVIAVSICSLCAATPAMAISRNDNKTKIESIHNSKGFSSGGITNDMIAKNADGSLKGTEVTTYGVYNSKDTTRRIIIGHKFSESEINLHKQYAQDEGLDFDKLYNGYEGIAADFDSQYDTIYFDAAHVQPRYGWGSLKSTYGTKTYWGYCDDLNAGWTKSGWKFIGNKWYYFNAHGAALDSTTQTIEGKSYTFNVDCSLVGNK